MIENLRVYNSFNILWTCNFFYRPNDGKPFYHMKRFILRTILLLLRVITLKKKKNQNQNKKEIANTSRKQKDKSTNP